MDALDWIARQLEKRFPIDLAHGQLRQLLLVELDTQARILGNFDVEQQMISSNLCPLY